MGSDSMQMADTIIRGRHSNRWHYLCSDVAGRIPQRSKGLRHLGGNVSLGCQPMAVGIHAHY